MHGIWGMSYKYHERAMVTNEKNLIRLWDIAYDGYNGGKDDTAVSWTEESGHRSYKSLKAETANTTMPYTGPSMMVCNTNVKTLNLNHKLTAYTHRSWHFRSTRKTVSGSETGHPPSCSTRQPPASLCNR